MGYSVRQSDLDTSLPSDGEVDEPFKNSSDTHNSSALKTAKFSVENTIISRVLSAVSSCIQSTTTLPITLFILGGVLALSFGGVVPVVSTSVNVILFLLCAILCFARWSTVVSVFEKSPLLLRFFAWLAAFLGIASVNIFWLSAIQSPHPVLGIVSKIGNMRGAIQNLEAFAIFGVITLLSAISYSVRPRMFLLLLEGLFIFVALVGLTHWLNDTGKLFWTFQAESTYGSERLRWPFVNPNHMGCFLLGGFWLTTGLLLNSIRKAKVSQASRRGSATLMQRIANGRLRKEELLVFARGIGLSLITLAMLGTLSRGAWLAGVVSAVLLFIAFKLGFIDLKVISEDEKFSKHFNKFKSKNPFVVVFRRFLPILMVGAPLIIVILMVLSQKGGDLLQDRVSYAVSGSGEDLRWRLYSDSLPLLLAHPLLGVGLGQWETSFQAFMSSTVANSGRPYYLHSDVFQLLIEAGLIGLLPLLLFVVTLIKPLYLRVTTSKSALTLALCLSAISISMAASFDFPSRIPVIPFTWACLLGILLIEGISPEATNKPAETQLPENNL